MKKDFISYARAAKDFVERLASDMKSRGIDVWLDAKGIGVGESIVSSIENGIEECDYFILVLSGRSVTREWVLREYRTVQNKQLSTEGKMPRILPVLLERCKIPTFLSDIKYADFSRSFIEGLHDLLSAFEIRLDSKNPFYDFVNYINGNFSDVAGLIRIINETRWDTIGETGRYDTCKFVLCSVLEKKNRLNEYIENGIKLVHTRTQAMRFPDEDIGNVVILPSVIVVSDVEDCIVCGPGMWHPAHGFKERILDLPNALNDWEDCVLKREIYLLPESCKWSKNDSYSDLMISDEDLKTEELVLRVHQI
jgi:hypothetical protein